MSNIGLVELKSVIFVSSIAFLSATVSASPPHFGVDKNAEIAQMAALSKELGKPTTMVGGTECGADGSVAANLSKQLGDQPVTIVSGANCDADDSRQLTMEAALSNELGKPVAMVDAGNCPADKSAEAALSKELGQPVALAGCINRGDY